MKYSVSDIPTVIGLLVFFATVYIFRVDYPDTAWPFAILIGLVIGGKALFISYPLIVGPVWLFKLVRRYCVKNSLIS